MSQVDDWSDGYTSDYLRDLNTYGPASANVPRSSVVSHRVQYRAPDTSDIPLAPGQNPEGSVYSNAPGARMGQLKSRSGYNPPAGGGYTAQTFPSSGGSGRRYARPKKQTQVSKPARKTQSAGKTQSAASAKRQVQNYGSYRDLSDPMSQRILANGSPEPKPPVESAVSRAQDITDQSDMYRAIAGLSSPPSANDSQSEVRASVPETDFNRGLMGGVGRQVEAISKPAPESSSVEDQFKNMPWYEDAKAHYEAVKKNMDDYGSALGMLKSTWDDIPWWAMVDPAGAPAKAAAAAAAAEGRRLYGPVVERLLAPKGPLTGGARTTLTSADEGLPVGYSLLRNPPKADTSALAGQTSNLVQQLRAAGIPEDQIAASIARINAEAAGREAAAAGREAAAAGREAAAAGGQAAGREAAAGASEQAAGAGRAGEAAADGGVSELANAGAAGRETAAGAATGSVSEGVDSASQQLIQHIRSGTLDEMERAWIEATAAGAAKAPGTIDASTQAILNEARAAGILGRDAAGAAGREAAAAGREAAGTGRAGEAAGAAARQGEGKAAGALSAYDRQQYRNYIEMVNNDSELADLVPSTLHRVVGNAARSIDSLSDAELSAFYDALNDAVNQRWVAGLFIGNM